MSDAKQPPNPSLETLDCLDARMIELDLLEQALNAGRDLTVYKLQRLEDIQNRRAKLQPTHQAEAKPAKKDVIRYMSKAGYVWDLTKEQFVGKLRPRPISYVYAEEFYMAAYGIPHARPAEAKPVDSKTREIDGIKTPVYGELREKLIIKLCALEWPGYVDPHLNQHKRNAIESLVDEFLPLVSAHLEAAVEEAVKNDRNTIGYELNKIVDDDVDHELEASDVVACYEKWRLQQLKQESSNGDQ